MPIDGHEKNRQCWNQMTDIHVDHPAYSTKQVIEGGSSLHKLEQDALGDVTGKTLLHLQCHFGLDTLSWARKGAIATGVDISDRAIEVANEVKSKAGLEADFVRSDLFDLPKVLDTKFEIVFQSYGTLGWLSYVNKWAEIVSHYLQLDGVFYFIDQHPIVWSFLENEDYFNDKPLISVDDHDYCDHEAIIKGEQHEYQYTVAQIINALIKQGLTIESYYEYPYSFDKFGDDLKQAEDGYWYPQTNPNRFPYMMSLKARKR